MYLIWIWDVRTAITCISHPIPITIQLVTIFHSLAVIQEVFQPWQSIKADTKNGNDLVPERWRQIFCSNQTFKTSDFTISSFSYHLHPCRHRMHLRGHQNRCLSGLGYPPGYSCHMHHHGCPYHCSVDLYLASASSYPKNPCICTRKKVYFIITRDRNARFKRFLKELVWDSAVHINNHDTNVCIYLLIQYSISICIWVTCIAFPIAICVLLSRVWNGNTVVLVLRKQYESALPETGNWCHQSPKQVHIDCIVAIVTFLQVGSRQRSFSSGYPSMSVSLPQR